MRSILTSVSLNNDETRLSQSVLISTTNFTVTVTLEMFSRIRSFQAGSQSIGLIFIDEDIASQEISLDNQLEFFGSNVCCSAVQ